MMNTDNKNNFFYFPTQKTNTGNKFNNSDDEDIDELPEDNFIEFKASRHKIPGVILHPPPPPIFLTSENDEDEDDDETKDTHESGLHKRGEWGNKLDFLFSCISVSVGLGNVWRFPYLCYKNGGGAFLLVYFIAMIFCGIPIFFQEVAIGQYLGSGGMTLVAQLCPMMKGVGIATMVVVFFLDIYYCVIIAWTFFYLISSLTAIPDLPWNSCDGWWNTKYCFNPETVENKNETLKLIENHVQILFHGHNRTTSPVEEFWEHRVLKQNQGLEYGLGNIQWELAGCLLLAWIFVYLIIWKGLHSSGKIIWFTALFPYFVMFILLIRAVTLEGALDGLQYYVRIDWSKLKESRTWIDGATQIFFAYSVGMGALPALGSYNKFQHDCYRDAIITCVVNTCTCLIAGVLVFSILGYMAHVQGTSLDNVVNSGPGLVFLTYPDLVLNLPASVIWSVIFFIMLLVLGIDSEFCNVEALVTGIVDNWPETLLKHRRLFTVGLCGLMFLLGVPMCTEGGVYLFQLMDFYSASGMSLLWVCFFQTIAIGWFFGTERFVECVEQMTSRKLSKFWFLCWKYFAPLVMAIVFTFYVFSYEPVTYGSDYKYPKWAEYMGLCMSLTSMVCVPGYAIYYMCTRPGSFTERINSGLTSNIKLRRSEDGIKQKLKDGFTPNIKRIQTLKNPAGLHLSESGVGLLRNASEFEMGNLTPNTSFIQSK